LSALLLVLLLDTYHVSPEGNDANDGRSPQKAWKTVAKVNATPVKPGDQVLFAKGGEWRESLQAGSSGAPGKPIVYAAYGAGAKPKFWGSDVLKSADFKPADGGTFTLAIAAKVASVLVDHQFLPPGSWSWKDGLLIVDRDPRADKRVWTACVRVDLVHSNGKNHLVFRDLVADESADAKDGYGFRVMGSDGVRLESCEAYRAGRHHFGVINSTNFVGTKLHCAWAMPQCPGGATFYVSFSDPSRKGDTHQWIDCSAERFDNPGGANYQVFYDHGEGLGPILIRNLNSKGGKFSVGSSTAAPVTIEGGLLEDNTLEIFGDHCRVNGLTIRGNGGVDQFGSDSLFENMVVAVAPKNGGPTGYGAGFLFRDGAKRNTVRFCTVLLEGDTAVQIVGRGSDTKVVGTILVSKKTGIEGEASVAEHNFRGGDPLLTPDYAPRPGSPVIGAAKVEAAMRPEADQVGKKRPANSSIGAREPAK
jgi:hypothetical protein